MSLYMDVQIKKAAPFELSESAISKISLLKESENNKFFRVYVTGGGCSGFQYGFKFDEFDQDDKNLTRAWLRTKGNSIEGGTSEVQLNVISKRVLNLPS